MADSSIATGASPGLARARPRVGQALSAAGRLPVVPIVILSLVVFAGIFGNLLVPHDPAQVNMQAKLTPPAWQAGGNPAYLLGTDHLGRDILSRLIAGARVSLLVGFTVVFVAGFIGTTMAVLSGYLGGWVDTVIMRITDIKLSMPFLVVAITLAGILGPGLGNMIMVLAVMGWASYARVLRAEVLRLKGNDFVRLAVVAGCSWRRIVIVHIVPNITNSLIVLASLQLGTTIIAAASLSFLGLGVPPPTSDWGAMLADGRAYITRAWWLSASPGLAIMFTVLGTNLLGDWLRLRLDPKYRQI